MQPEATNAMASPFGAPKLNFVLFRVFEQLLDDEAALAQLGTCACVSVAWREAAYDPRLWTNLTKWQRTKEVRRCASFCDERLSSQLALSQVNATVLRRLIERSHGGLLHLDTSPLPIMSEDVERALSGQGLEGMLLSLRVDGKTIKANAASRDTFVDRGAGRRPAAAAPPRARHATTRPFPCSAAWCFSHAAHFAKLGLPATGAESA